MASIWNEAARLLSDGKRFVLAVVASRSGSAPRAVGSAMLVREDGTIVSTIGGGGLEARAVASARELFSAGGWRFVEFDLSGKDAADEGMICGGTTAIFLDRASLDDLPVFEAAARSEEGGGRGFLSYRLDADPRRLIFEEDIEEGGEGGQYVRIPMRGNGTVYIFGGGHVGLETARIASLVDFRTVVLDDREEFVNPDRFPDSTTILVDSFETPPPLALDGDSYIVVVTRGHLHDFTVLDYALGTDAGYIGMIGSRRKRDLIYGRLLAKGHARERLAAVHSPIGLEIGSDTPAEIAVSIVAELIRTRADRKGM